MSKLLTDEFSRPIQALDFAATQQVTIGAESAASEPLGSNTHHVILCSDVDCYFNRDADAVADLSDGTSFFLPAGVPFLLRVTPGGTVEVIQAAVAGVLNIAEVV